jgi:hypothetical protein
MTTLYSVPKTGVFDEAERSRVIASYDVAGAPQSSAANDTMSSS